MLTIGSLFAGIGGIERGLEWAGLGPVRWQVEVDPKCRVVLAKHWHAAERYDDVRYVGRAQLAPVDLICGGFPCTDISSAGRRAGLAGPHSGLWYEFARIVEELHPRWVVVENVRSGARKWVDPVRGDLERLGYASIPIPLAAGDCGAPHERARVFVLGARALADADHASRDVRAETREDVRNATRHAGWAAEPDLARVVSRLPCRMDRERMLGNAVVPQCAQVVGSVIRTLELERRAWL